MIAKILTSFITFYRYCLSPLIPPRCRYYPTCSAYALTAIRWHGVIRGSHLASRRICRCHPFGGHGIDFVPLPLYQQTFYPVLFTPLLLPAKTLNTAPNLINHSQFFLPIYAIGYGVFIDHTSYNAHFSKRIKTEL